MEKQLKQLFWLLAVLALVEMVDEILSRGLERIFEMMVAYFSDNWV